MLAELPFIQDLSELELIRLAVELGAVETGGPLSIDERLLVDLSMEARRPSAEIVESTRASIIHGGDPLGEELCRMRPPLQRRAIGAFYTPLPIVHSMVEWVLETQPKRVVDAGCGSGRFAAAVARRSHDLEIVAVDSDPAATLLTRAALAVLPVSSSQVIQGDYTTLNLGRIAGRTAFVGNPPYVRHHDLSPQGKAWAAWAGKMVRCRVSGLSGLHVYFYLATALHSRPGDVGCFVTSAEWLDVGYGAAIRDMLLNGLGVQSIHVFDSRVSPFDDAQTTAIVACFEVGSSQETIRVRKVRSIEDLGRLDTGQPLRREHFTESERWTSLLRPLRQVGGAGGQVPLGSLARIHRGMVTGGNRFFVMTRARARELGLEPWCRPAITDAHEIFDAKGILRDSDERRLLLDIPRDIDRAQFPALDTYLKQGEVAGNGRRAVADGYICSHRRPWWYLGRQDPPPIVASYMARQAPAFALNPDRLALVNIGHGIYPTQNLDAVALAILARQLNESRETFRGEGRTYQGGLEKFEPREMEALLIEWPNAK
jgi:adenine-specific DNA-methyltransferase